MITVYNPLTDEWERLDDLVRPLPVIARDTRLVIANDTTPFTPTLATSNAASHTDLFGNTDSSRANISIAVGSTNADVVIRDAWRIRRFIVVCQRTGSGSTNVGITCIVWARLLAPDGTPTTNWRGLTAVTETTNLLLPLRFVIPTSLSGVHGFDQYRITFRRDPDSTPAPELSLVRVYAEF
jgi:hypothetical protein